MKNNLSIAVEKIKRKACNTQNLKGNAPHLPLKTNQKYFTILFKCRP